jgi:hypothetical protein
LNDFSHFPATTSNLALPTDRTAMPEKEGHMSGVYYGPLILICFLKGKLLHLDQAKEQTTSTTSLSK